MTMEKRVQKSKVNVTLELAIFVTIVVTLIPIVWIAILAFLPNKSIIGSSFDFSFWLGNFRTLADPGQNFVRQIFNSLTITFGTVILTLVIGSGSGYSLSKLRPPKWATTPVLSSPPFFLSFRQLLLFPVSMSP